MVRRRRHPAAAVPPPVSAPVNGMARAPLFGDEPRREQGKHGQLRAGEQTLWC